MAVHCSICNSTDVVAGLDKMQCLTCGAILDFAGQPAQTTEYIGTSEPVHATPATIEPVPVPSGEDGYIEGVASEAHPTVIDEPAEEPAAEEPTAEAPAPEPEPAAEEPAPAETPA
jgi:hypothetical protein